MAHDHSPPARQGVAVNPVETKSLLAEAREAGSTQVGEYLGYAAAAETQSIRTYWLHRTDTARYFAARRVAQDYFDQRARENAEADARLMGTEATVEVARVVGNAVVLKLVPGTKAPASYSLVGRIAGETRGTGYGEPQFGQWVIQNLRMNAIYEFIVVSEDEGGFAQVDGPSLAVPIGNVSTDAIQAAERAAAKAAYEAREEAEAARAREYSERVAADRAERAESLRRQQEQADIDNARRERERIAREEAHRKAVAELPMVRPRDTSVRLQGLPDGRVLAHLEWTRGTKRPLFYRFELNGTVLGDDPGGRWSGAKPDGHRYTRTVEVPAGADARFTIAGVTNHGDGEHSFTIPVPADLCKPNKPATRMERIVAAMRSFSGRRTRDGRPYVRDLRRHAGMPDITIAERNQAHTDAIAT